MARTQDKLPVLASFSILGDLVREVGGNRVSISVLVGPGGDAHVYSPVPSDVQAVRAARVIIANGAGFEGWLVRLLKAADAPGRTVIASSGLRLRRAGPHGHDVSPGAFDPHAWQDVANAHVYVANIRDGLAFADPAGKEEYQRNADAYRTRLDALDRAIRAAIATIPPARRRAIVSHDSLGYFAAAYGLTFLSPRGISTEADMSAQDLARVIRQVRSEKVAAVFLESIRDRRLAERIAAETGARIGGTLYADTLSPPDGPAATYEAMMRHNAETLAKALAPQS